MKDTTPVIVSACRTPIGKLRGALSNTRPDDLLAACLKEALLRAGVKPDCIDEVVAGCANQAGEDNRNVARMSALLAGFPYSIPGVTLNRLCASGLEAIAYASKNIRLSEASAMLCGGVESMTRAPWAVKKNATAFCSGPLESYDTALGWRFPNPQLAARFPLESMGETAENVAQKFNISREAQDKFALNSHKKALAAISAGAFKDEIIPIDTQNGQFMTDEGPRANSSLEKLASLQAVFRKNGTVTAGNSSTLNDGAAALLVTSAKYAADNGLKSLAKIVGSASAGVDPQMMGIGPVESTKKLFARCKLSMQDMDYVELNEAFAAQALAVSQCLDISEERLNIHGGAIALGHPLGCSGARLVTTLINILHKKDATFGLATLCVGVGQGVSMIIERV